MKKIYLFNAGPYKAYSVKTRIYFPTQLLYIATLLKKDYCVQILDRMVEDFEINNLTNILEKNSSPPACFINFGTKEIDDAVKIADVLRQTFPNTKIVAVGLHSSMYPQQVIQDTAFDMAICLDPEVIVEELLKGIEEGCIYPMPNLWAKIENNIIQPVQLQNYKMDLLPLLDYSILDMENYLIRSAEFLTGDKELKKIIRFSTSRGCLYKCNFCTDPFKGYARMSNEKIKENLHYIVNQFDPDIVFFDDPEFFMNRQEPIELLRYIKANFRFKCIGTSRAHYYREEYISKGVMDELRNTWLVWDVGAESSSSDTLKGLKKGIKRDHIVSVAKYAGQVGVRAGFSFMVALPNESEEDMLETIYLIEELKEYSLNNIIITYQYYQPIGTTELALSCGFHQPKNIRDWIDLFDKRTGSIDIRLNKWILRRDFVDYLMLVVKYHINEIYSENEQEFALEIRSSWLTRKANNDWSNIWETHLAETYNLSNFSYEDSLSNL